METVRSPTQDNNNGQIGPSDIRRTRTEEGTSHAATATAFVKQANSSAKPVAGTTLASVPSFADTQQRWEEPRPYGEPASAASPTTGNASQNPQQNNALKEASLVFVRSPVQSQATQVLRSILGDATSPLLDVKTGHSYSSEARNADFECRPVECPA